VMGSCVQAEDCLSALNLTQWNIHHAIKLVKLKNLIKVDYVTDCLVGLTRFVNYAN
jgi:hypothetical protein